MLRFTVEIWPGGDKTRARAVAIANVANLSDLADAEGSQHRRRRFEDEA
jgi:hypothetical protein